jgi:hypothetical protein
MRRSAFIRLALAAGAGPLGIACSPSEVPPFALELVTVATLRGVGDSVLLASRLPAVDGRGTVAAFLHLPEGTVGLFDSTGAFRGRLGRPGTGPGEFRDARTLGFGRGDSLWVTDRAFWAHLFAVHPTSRFVRTIQFPQRPTGQVTPHGFLSAGVVGATGLLGPHLATWDGTLRWQFGERAAMRHIGDRMQPVALLDSTRVWTVREGEYVLELLGRDGTKHHEIGRRVPWFTGAPDRDPAEGGIAPHVTALRLDPAGRLMVLIRRGNPTRPPLARPSPPSPIERAAPVAQPDLAEAFEGVLEVLDPTDGRLLASRVVSGNVLGFPAPDLVAEAAFDAQGSVTLYLKRVTLQPRR